MHVLLVSFTLLGVFLILTMVEHLEERRRGGGGGGIKAITPFAEKFLA